MTGYKHSAVDELEGCPHKPVTPANGKAYRWTFDVSTPEGEARSFVPTAIIYGDERVTMCKAWALSFFVSAEAAYRRFHDLKKSFPNLGNEVGDRIAEGVLTPSHGGVTKPDRAGHVSLFEYTGADFTALFAEVRKL